LPCLSCAGTAVVASRKPPQANRAADVPLPGSFEPLEGIWQGFTFDDRDFRAPIGEHACGKETADALADGDVLRRCRHCSLHSVQRLATLVEIGVELLVLRDGLVLAKFGDAAVSS
jgi:hypothetical protein